MMKPTLVRFPEATMEWLRRGAKRFGISIAEYLRRVVDEVRKTKHP